MQIDWITVSAQIVNFLILVWLLKRFLYRPVMDAMQRRENHIEGRLREADDREESAETAIRNYQRRADSLEQEREEVVSVAREEAERLKKQWLDEARDEVEAMRQAWQQQLQEEQADFLNGLRREAADSMLQTLRDWLRRLADVELESHILEQFLLRLQEVEPDSKARLEESVEPIRIRSAFALSEDQRERVKTVLESWMSQVWEVEFEQAPELICGVELFREGWRLSWSLDDALQSLGDNLAQQLRSQAHAGVNETAATGAERAHA